MSREKQIEEMVEFLNNRINVERNSYFGKGCITLPLIEADKILDILKGYRKQSENVVEFPCKIGQTIYVVDVCANKIIKRKVTELAKNEFGTIYVRCFGFGYPESSIGKTIFLTKAEAEAKMKGGAE